MTMTTRDPKEEFERKEEMSYTKEITVQAPNENERLQSDTEIARYYP